MPDKFKDPKFVIDLHAHCTLCDPSVGLYGRTVVCKSGDPVAPKDLTMHQWVALMSDLALNNTYLMCELIVNFYDKANPKMQVSNISLGILAIRILQDKVLATTGTN